jgi:hypothetical protein
MPHDANGVNVTTSSQEVTWTFYSDNFLISFLIQLKSSLVNIKSLPWLFQKTVLCDISDQDEQGFDFRSVHHQSCS